MNIILFGPPGAGKGTQADNIVKSFNLFKFSTGDLLRKAIRNNTDLGKKIKSVMEEGSLVPDSIIDNIITKILSDKKYYNCLIFDGYPRNLDQAKNLDLLLKKYNEKLSCALYLNVSKDVIFKRILGRQTCTKCGLIFNEYFNPSTKTNHPCGSKFLVKRIDDNEETITGRFKTYLDKTKPIYGYNQIISPIVQGGTNLNLRKQSALELMELNCDMYAIGGLAVGEPKEEMLTVVNYMDSILPKEKPRYLMGVGTPADLVESILNGIDMFDCVIPTRNARNSQLFSFDGKINIRNAKYSDDFSPIDENNFSPISNQYSKSYLHHLFKINEILGLRIATEHNL